MVEKWLKVSKIVSIKELRIWKCPNILKKFWNVDFHADSKNIVRSLSWNKNFPKIRIDFFLIVKIAIFQLEIQEKLQEFPKERNRK